MNELASIHFVRLDDDEKFSIKYGFFGFAHRTLVNLM